MSVARENILPSFQLGMERDRSTAASAEADEKESPDIRLEKARWTQVGLGAIALGLYMLLTATSDAIWPVLFGPFMLLGIARLMGLRSLWKRQPA